MLNKKVYLCFDLENDVPLKAFVLGESKLPSSNFQVSGASQKIGLQSHWEETTRREISNADMMLVLVGPNTAKSNRVLREIALANELGKPKLQVVGYINGQEEWAFPDAGTVHPWERLSEAVNVAVPELAAQ